MNTPKGYRCANCGNMLPISRSGIMKCECCGSEYKVEDDQVIPFRVEHIQFRTETIGASYVIPEEMLKYNPEAAFEVTLEKMAHGMAEKIAPLMDIRVGYDPMYFTYKLDAKLRVAIPSQPPSEVLQKAISVNADMVNAKRR